MEIAPHWEGVLGEVEPLVGPAGPTAWPLCLSVPVSFQQNSAGPSRAPEGSGGCQSGSGPQSLGPSCPGRAAPAPTRVPALTSGAAAKPDSSVTPRLGQSQTLSSESRPGIKQSEGGRCNGDSKQSLPLGPAAWKASHSSSDSPSESAMPGQAPRPAPRRTDISELPRIPKIRRDRSRGDEGPSSRQGVELPSSCISRLTGREGPGET